MAKFLGFETDELDPVVPKARILVSPGLQRKFEAFADFVENGGETTYVYAPPEPMSDARLAEIEANAQDAVAEYSLNDLEEICAHEVPALVAEVRRLRRALQLSEASRGTPSVVGGD